VSDPKLNIIMQNHEYGVPPAHYQRWPVLGSFYNVLSTSKDRNGLEYISTIEGKKYPFTGGKGGRGIVQRIGSKWQM
jgi:gamma-glutamyl hydrolase